MIERTCQGNSCRAKFTPTKCNQHRCQDCLDFRRCNGRGCANKFPATIRGQRFCDKCRNDTQARTDKPRNRKRCKKCGRRRYAWGCPACDAKDPRVVTLIALNRRTAEERQLVVSPSSRQAREFKFTAEEIAEQTAVREVPHISWTLL